MIATELYSGQGLGNQLWVYAVTRAAALRAGLDFGIMGRSRFKGSEFLDLDFGLEIDYKLSKGPSRRFPNGFEHYYQERKVLHPIFEVDVTPFDKNLVRLSDRTLIDGTMQSERYIKDCKPQIQDWFKVQEDIFEGCVISLRGGEYKAMSKVFLNKSYYQNAIERMRAIDPKMKFLVVTDDEELSKEYFPDFPVISSGGVKIYWGRFYRSPKSKKIGKDFGNIQNARYLILSNSSFSWWGAWTNTIAQMVIAPKYWAAHNISDGFWSVGDSLTEGWQWLDREGKFFSYEDCLLELEVFEKINPALF